MDNPQVRLSREFQLGWLVCAIESEGSFQLAWSRRANEVIQIVPRVNVGNREAQYIEYVAQSATAFDLPCYVARSGNMVYAVWYGMKRVLRLLDLVEPLLTIKQDRALVLRRFIEHRLAQKRNAPYGQLDKDLFLQMRALNGSVGRLPEDAFHLAFEGNPNDYMPDAVAIQ